MVPFAYLVSVLVNGSHGLGFTCKFALLALLLTDCIVVMTSCHDPELDPWFICSMGVVVLGAATTHTAELYLRRSYAEKVRADAETMHGRAEEAGKRRQLEERMEQLQAEKERLLYDMQRRGRPLDDDDDRSAICRGLQAGRSQPYPPSLGDTGPDTDPDADPSEAGGPAPSDSLPTLPPGPPSSGSGGSVASYPQRQLAAEALADMAMNAVAPQQSVPMAAHQPEVHRPIQRATPALCVSTQGLDSTEVATAVSVQQLDANGVSAQAIDLHRATQPIPMSARANAAAPTCGKQATALQPTLKQKFEAFVMCDYTPRHPDDLPQSQWVSYDTLYQLFQPHAPLDVWQKGPGNLKQLITEWYQGDPAFSGLAPSAWCKRLVTRNEPQHGEGRGGRKTHCTCFSFEYRPNAALRIDGSKAPTGSWDRTAFLSGFQNSAEIAARELRCAELPSDLVGTYYRNGHARFVGYDGKKVRHPFDADGLVTGVTLDGRRGTAIIRQRYVATDGAIAERAEQRSLYPGQFGNPRALWDGGVDFKNLANTNCLWHGGKLLALWEGSRPHILDPLSLATRGEWDVDGLVGSGPTDNFAAHPRLGTDGGVANFAYAGNPAAGTTTVRFWDFQPGSYDLRSPAQKHVVPGFGLFHDFLVTENYFVLVAAPATWGPVGQPLRALQMTLEFVTGKLPVGSMICFDESQPTTVYLFPRDERTELRPIAIELDTFFSFHHANAWEEGDTLVFDTVSTPKLIVDDSSLEGTGKADKGDSNRFLVEDIDYEQDAPRTDLVRYTLGLKRGSYSRRALSTRHVEFPSVAPSVRGRRHRFVYTTAGSKADGVSPAASVLKTDTEDASNSQIWLARPFEFCGEVIFTPRAGSTAEDDGYLLTLCYDGNRGTSALLVLDARRVADGPIARVPISLAEEEGGEPLPVDAAIAGPGHGLHATFVPGLAPTLHEVQEAEEHRGRLGSRFLSDA